MAPVIGAAILTAAGIADTSITIGATAITLSSIVGSAVITAATIGLALAFRPKVNTAAQQQAIQQAVVSQALGPRVRAYGRVKLGGVRALFDVQGGTELIQVIMMVSDKIDAFEEFWIADQSVITDGGDAGGEVTTGEFYSAVGLTTAGVSTVYIETHDGDPDQLASANLIGNFPGYWTANHRLRGIAYQEIAFATTNLSPDNFFKVYPQSYDTPVMSVLRACLVWDPRLGDDPAAKSWSQNPILAILDYAIHPDGDNQPLAFINLNSFKAFATRCDIVSPLKNGGAEPLYTLGMSYTFEEDPADVYKRMCDACDAELYEDGLGRIAVRGGGWAAPLIAIDRVNILGVSLSDGADALSAYNELVPTYVDTNNAFTTTQAQAWVNQAVQDKYGRVTQDLPLPAVQSFAQARRLAKIKMARDNPDLKGTITTNLVGLQLLQPQEDDSAIPTFTLNIPELGINRTFIVNGAIEIKSDLSAIVVPVASFDASAYAWDPATEEGSPAGVPLSGPAVPVPVPTSLTVGLVTVVSAALGAPAVTAINATVDTPADSGLTLNVEYRSPPNTGSWAAMSVPTDTLQGQSSAVPAGLLYEVRAQFVNASFVAGAWCTAVQITSTPDAVAPDTPTAFTATAAPPAINLQWTNAPAHYLYGKVYRNTHDDFSSAGPLATVYGAPGAVSTYQDPVLPAGTWYYWVLPVNVSGVPGVQAGSVNATI